MKVYEILLVDVIFLILAAVAAVLALVYCFGVFLFGGGLAFIRPDGSHPFIGREPIALVYLVSGLLIQAVLIYGFLVGVNFAVRV